MINAILHDLRLCWKKLMLTGVLYRIIAFALLTPVVAILFQTFVSMSGRTVLADEDILFFFFKPLGWACLIAVGALSIAIIAFEQIALMVIVVSARQGERLHVIQALRFSAVKALPILRLTVRMVAWGLLIIAPFLLAAGATYMALLTNYDINYYLTEKPPQFWTAVALGGVIGLGLLIVAVEVASVWLFAFPLMLFENVRPKDALRISRERTKGHRRRIALWVVAWGAAGFLLSTLAHGAVNWLGRVVVANVAGPLTVVLLAVGAVLALFVAVNLALSLLSTAAFSALLVNLYVQLGGNRDVDLSDLVSADSAETKFALKLTRRNVIAATFVLSIVATIVGALVLHNLRLEDKTAITAHRGASAAAPENTLAAIRQAIEDDADWAEIDVQETADGEVVVMHDSDFKKIAGKDLNIWDATVDDLKDLDIGSWFSPKFKDERVATLDQVLEMCNGKIGVNIELKSYGHGDKLEERVIECVERHAMENEIVIMSLKRDAVAKVKQLRPSWTVGLLTAVAFGDLTKEEADFVAVSIDVATRPFIRSAHDAGKEVHVWTVNDVITMSTMMGRGADNLITDEPALARTVLEQRKQMTSIERLLVEAAMFFRAEPEEFVVFKKPDRNIAQEYVGSLAP